MSPVKVLLTEECLGCPNIEVQTTIDKMYTADTPTYAFGYICCKHTKNCKKVLGKDTITNILERLAKNK